MRIISALTALGLAVAAVAAPPPPVDEAIARRVRADVEFLASDRLEGRDTGSRGHAIAADYVAGQFRAIGLEPAGDKGSWYQQVPFRRASFDKPPRLTLTIGGKPVVLEQGKDASLRPSVTAKQIRRSAGLVFVGYGLKDTRFGFDDYRGLDVRGKIVVALDGTPTGLPSDIAAHLKSTKDEMAAAAGAVGFVGIGGRGGRAGEADPVQRASRPRIDWVDSAGRAGTTPPGLELIISFSREWAARLFEGAPKSLAAVRAAVKGKGRPRGFALTPTIAVEADAKWEDFTSPEVIGLLRGSDPVLAAEHVVLMGHLDHLGIKPNAKLGEDAIYNGALDNAAGVATMLEAARLFAAQPARPKRSILFIANTGEERGLLGASYYANHPTVTASSIVGLVDLDMPLLLYPFTDVTAFGADHSTIGATVAEAGSSMNVAMSPDPMPEEAIFVRSDHYMFVKRGIPAVLLMTGHANGGKAKWKDFLESTYHSVNDDLTQPIDWQAGGRYAVLNYRIARAMADAPQRPMWLTNDYFGDLYDVNGPRRPAGTPRRP
ncbi:MAG: M20/M25/M40 family metallo-hydrolase [Sphingomonas sp.]|uniref:M20/M25/M40 family metallo-hydrolase n=1 Tax=Sphingomonas sp. TaxID=28214 RepID=UPI00183BC302|nr:M20/M25/M40 family metallo-hydrolase [Sphingomonas sp.]MBA3667860.1 M20/M25/M40 family metallo-hydrolase [Sphingomonas sp.]